MGLARIGDALGLSKLPDTTAGAAGAMFEVALNAAKTQQGAATKPLAAYANGQAYAMRPLPDGPGVVIPTASTDPEAVAAWWSGLTSATRQKLIDEHYAQLGTLRGLPAGDIDRVNRLRLDEDIAGLREKLRIVTGTINGDGATGGEVDPALFREANRLRVELTNAEKMKDQMDRLDSAHEKGEGPKPYLLTYFYQNEGRFAVALGNPDTARNTAVLVPGSGHDVKHEGDLSPPSTRGAVSTTRWARRPRWAWGTRTADPSLCGWALTCLTREYRTE